jgi:hypothetical protein
MHPLSVVLKIRGLTRVVLLDHVGQPARPAMIPLFVNLLIGHAKRTPYLHLADYMQRFWVRRHNDDKSNWAARVHNIKRSDLDRALHDHPWKNISIVLMGGYWEVMPGIYRETCEAEFVGALPEFMALHEFIHQHGGPAASRPQMRELKRMDVYWRGPGTIVRRRADALHRLILPQGADAWSLFIMGPKVREWGFQTITGWVHNAAYLQALGRAA